MDFSLPEKEKNRIHDYLSRIGRMQSNVILASFIAVTALVFLRLAEKFDLLQLSSGQLSSLSSIMVSMFIIIVATTFLKLSTPLMNRFFFFLDAGSRNVILSVWNYGVWAVALLIVFAQFTGHLQSLGISIGVFSAGLAIALQQPITSVVGWMIIVSRKPYTVGDRIVVRDIKGDVVDVTIFYTVLREFGREMGGDDPTGVKITIPNSIVLSEPILNYTSDFPYIWDYVSVSITYESDIKLARELAKKAALDVLGESMKKAADRMRPYLYGTPQETSLLDEPVVYTRFADSAVVLDIKYICRATRRRRVRSDISERVLELVNMPSHSDYVTIAYPHTELVFHDQSIEGAFKKYLEKQK